MALVPFIKNREIVQYSFPQVMDFGTTGLMGLVGIVFSFIPNEFHKWTNLALSAFCLMRSLFGFWQTRTVTLTLPEADEDAIKTHLQFLKKISKKLDKMIPSSEHSAVEESSLKELKKGIKSKLQAVKQQFQLLNGKVEGLEDDLANLSSLLDGGTDEESSQNGDRALQTVDQLSQRLNALMNSRQSSAWSNSSSVTTSPQVFTPNHKGRSVPSSPYRATSKGTPVTPPKVRPFNLDV